MGHFKQRCYDNETTKRCASRGQNYGRHCQISKCRDSKQPLINEIARIERTMDQLNFDDSQYDRMGTEFDKLKRKVRGFSKNVAHFAWSDVLHQCKTMTIMKELALLSTIKFFIFCWSILKFKKYDNHMPTSYKNIKKSRLFSSEPSNV